MKVLQYNHQGSFDYLILWIQKGFIGFQILFYYFDWFFNCLIMQRSMHYFHRIWLFMNAPGSVSKYLLSHRHYLHSFRSSQTEVFTLSLPETAKPQTLQLSTKVCSSSFKHLQPPCHHSRYGHPHRHNNLK